MSGRQLAGDVETLAEQGYLSVSVDGTPVVVVEHDEQYYAIESVCLHQGRSLCGGSVRRALEADHEAVGEQVTEYYTETPAIACPRHGWEYSLETGEHLGDDTFALDVFDVVREGSQLFVRQPEG